MRAYSPGRVNLMGDHTDYNAGLALPMAIDLGTTVVFEPDDTNRIVLSSSVEAGTAEVRLDVSADGSDIGRIEPRWARYVAAIVAALRPREGGHGTVETTLPVGAGLSSSASFEVALALALGASGHALAVAQLCQRAEQVATGVAAGVMDQLVACAAVEGCALLVDFANLSWRAVPIPADVEVLVIDSGQRRTLHRSHYATRRLECEEAAAVFSAPLGSVDLGQLERIEQPLLRRRARHVVTECERVRRFVAAMERSDAAEAGRLMTESHRSLASDFEVSTERLDELVEKVTAKPGILGARMTGAGFGGCIVALAEANAVQAQRLTDAFGSPVWRVRPSSPAQICAASD